MVGTTQVVLAYQAQSTTFMWRTLPYPGPVAEAVVCPDFGDGTPHCFIIRPLQQNHQHPPWAQIAQISQISLLKFNPPH